MDHIHIHTSFNQSEARVLHFGQSPTYAPCRDNEHTPGDDDDAEPNFQGIVAGWAGGWLSDGVFRGRRWPPILIANVSALVLCLILVNIPLWSGQKAHFALYYLNGATINFAGLYFSCEICGRDAEKRALILAMSNDASFVLQSIVPNFVWKQVDYPRATKGLWFTCGLCFFLIFIIFTVRHLHNRDKILAIKEKEADSAEDDRARGEYENYDEEEKR